VFLLVLEDECASATEIFQCGQKEDAALVNGLIFDNKGAAAVKEEVLCWIFHEKYEFLAKMSRSARPNPLVQELRNV